MLELKMTNNSIWKPIWKWLVSAAAVVGVAIWAIAKWLGVAATTSVVVKTIATTAIVATIAIFSFHFGIKENMSPAYSQKVRELVEFQDYDEAIKYLNELIYSLDKHVEKLQDKVLTIVNKSEVTSERDINKLQLTLNRHETAIERAMISRRAMELVSADVRYAGKKISQDQWLREYEEVFANNMEIAGRVAKSHLLFNPSNEILSAQQVWIMLLRDYPADARAEMALWLAKLHTPEILPDVDTVTPFYSKLIFSVRDTNAALSLLRQYIEIMKAGDFWKNSDRFLELILTLFPDTELGSVAAYYQLENMTPGYDRDLYVVNLVEKHANTRLADNLKAEYLYILISAQQFEKALKYLDNEGMLEKVDDQKDVAKAMYALTEKAVEVLNSSTKVKTLSSGDKEDATQAYTTDLLCLQIAEQYCVKGDHLLAAELFLISLQKVDGLLVNLVSGKPLKRLDEIVNPSDLQEMESLAKYFLVLSKIQIGLLDNKELHFKEMLLKSLSDELKPYILVQLIQHSVSSNDYESAFSYLTSALNIMPDSDLLLKLRDELEIVKEDKSRKGQLRKDKEKYFHTAMVTTSQREAIEELFKVAEIHQNLNEMEQAIGVYKLIADKYPGHHKAPVALIKCIEIIERSVNDIKIHNTIDRYKYLNQRLVYFRNRLGKEYPGSRNPKE